MYRQYKKFIFLTRYIVTLLKKAKNEKRDISTLPVKGLIERQQTHLEISQSGQNLKFMTPMPPSRNRNHPISSNKQQKERNKNITTSKHEEQKGTRVINRTNSSKNNSNVQSKATNPHEPRIVGKKI